MAAGAFLFEHVFWSQYEGEESPVTSIPETDAKEAGLTEGRDTNREEEGPGGGRTSWDSHLCSVLQLFPGPL